jgi:hypothetical protein
VEEGMALLEKSAGQGHAYAMFELGKAVQVDPVKPKLKPPGTKHLKLKCDMLLSTSAFKFNVCRYNWGTSIAFAKSTSKPCSGSLK